jgi:hypothetical protein
MRVQLASIVAMSFETDMLKRGSAYGGYRTLILDALHIVSSSAHALRQATIIYLSVDRGFTRKVRFVGGTKNLFRRQSVRVARTFREGVTGK